MSQVPVPTGARFAPSYPILTERLLLRPFSRADVAAVHSYRCLPEVAEYLFDPPMSLDECAEAVRARTTQIAFTAEGDRIVLAVERRADAHLVGEVSLTWRSIADQQAEIGYIISPSAQRQGFASEAAMALLAFGFEQAELHRIYARCDARNEASTLVMRRLGMHQEAHFMEHRFNKGRWEEELIWAILGEDWHGRR